MTESGGSSSKPHKMKLIALVILSLSGKRHASKTLYEVLLFNNSFINLGECKNSKVTNLKLEKKVADLRAKICTLDVGKRK